MISKHHLPTKFDVMMLGHRWQYSESWLLLRLDEADHPSLVAECWSVWRRDRRSTEIIVDTDGYFRGCFDGGMLTPNTSSTQISCFTREYSAYGYYGDSGRWTLSQ